MIVLLLVLPFLEAFSSTLAILGADDKKDTAADPGGLGNGCRVKRLRDEASHSNDDTAEKVVMGKLAEQIATKLAMF